MGVHPPARRLLLLTDSLVGGLGAAVAAQAAWFSDHGWVVAVAAPVEDQSWELPDGVVRLVVPVPPTARRALGMRDAARRLREEHRRFGSDVVHCHGLRSLLIALAGLQRRPFVSLHGAGAVVDDPRGYHLVRRAALRAAPLLSRGAFSAAPEFGGRWRFTPLASPRLQELDRLPFPDDGVPTFLWLGRLATQKRADVFVDAMAALGRRRDVVGLVAGDGPLADELRERAERAGAPVRFLGHCADVAPLLEQAWAVALFSRYEALTFAVQEAMWSGRPVVSSPLPGIEWLVDETGLLAADAGEAAAAFDQLCDHTRAAALAERAARRIREVMDPTGSWGIVAQAYDRAV